MSRIFISYRREDSDIWVGRLADELRKHFPPEQVFQDIASIDPGADFGKVLDEALAAAAAMLVVIGPHWLSATDRNGRKRLESPADLVHQEVAESLRRPGVRVFPLLVNGAEMPSEEDLPDPLKPLARRHAFELTVRHWANDVAQLVQTLKRAPGLADLLATGDAPVPQRAEQEAKRREAGEGVAKDDAQRIAAEEQAKRKADASVRSKAEEEVLRRVDEAARRRAEQEEARRKAAIAAQENVATQKAGEAQEPAVEEQLRTKRSGRPETGASIGTATRGISTGEAGVPTPKFSWKPLAAIGAIVGAGALLVFVSYGERPLPLPTTAPPTGAAQADKPSTPPSASAAAAPDPTKVPAPAVTRSTGDVFRDCEDCPQLVWLPEGVFTMGSPDDERGWVTDESPRHKVRIGYRMAVASHEVSRGEFAVFARETGYSKKGCSTYNPRTQKWEFDKEKDWRDPGFPQSDDHPVVCVSWDDAHEYLKWLNGKLKLADKSGRYRLLSETEWEYAARANPNDERRGWARYWAQNWEGSDRIACGFANIADASLKTKYPSWPWSTLACDDAHAHTAPVTGFKANGFGLYHMIGNVWEWVQDCYKENYKDVFDDGRPWESGDCGRRVVRGNSWGSEPEGARAANRGRNGPGFRSAGIGFRVARTL